MWHDVRFRRIHDLEEIGKQCVQVDLTLGSLLARAETLSEYATRFRYPGARYEPGLEEGKAALALAREVVGLIGVHRRPSAAKYCFRPQYACPRLSMP
jgi:HEPN domain